MASSSWGSLSGRVGQIHTSLGTDVLILMRFTMVERMSQPFTLTCEVLSQQPVDFSAYLGSAVSVTVSGDAFTGRVFHGVLTEASDLDPTDDAVHYQLVVRPWLWLLSLGRNSRIFQNDTALGIIRKVFTSAGISAESYTDSVQSAGAATRNYCVQYEESDFAFVSRLMEEEGIYYYFAHSSGSHVMTLCDGPGCHSAFSQTVPLNRQNIDESWVERRLWSWSSKVRPTPTVTTLRDFHMMQFGDPFAGRSEATGDPVSAELYTHPGGYSHISDSGAQSGTTYAATRLQAARAEKIVYSGAGDAFAIPVGSFLSVQPVEGDTLDQAASILVVAANYNFVSEDFYAAATGDTLKLAVEGVPKTTTWRPPMTTPRPYARGPQVATVVGASGQVIDPDAYGRVKVQFSWDRLGSKDQNSSCWIRVSQGWADGGFGSMHLPRVGEEVIVDFFDGDLDRPVITGRVYNATKTVPYTLPDDKTKSTWKSQTVGDSGQYPDTVNPPQATDKGFNELRFEDKGGSEEVFVHAQRNFTGWYRFDEVRTTGHNTTISVGYNRDITIKNNETKTVQEGDESHTISQGSLTTEITQGNETRKVVAGKRTTTISGNDALTVETGNQTIEVQTGSVSVTSPQKIVHSVTPASVQLTPESITLSIGASSIQMTAESIQISAPQITISAEATLQASAAEVQVSGEAMMTLQAALVMIN